MLIKMDLSMYQKFVKDKKGKMVLHVELQKALYGTMKAALLFWRLISSKLVEWGFIINPYDWCVANKTINGKQCTILWHVDNLKILRIDENVVFDIIRMIDNDFGKESTLTMTCRRIHDYLGMTLVYTIKGKVMIKIIDYVERMLDDLPAEFDRISPTPAVDHLFPFDDEFQKKYERKGTDLSHVCGKIIVPL